jgi:hypothetical protein
MKCAASCAWAAFWSGRGDPRGAAETAALKIGWLLFSVSERNVFRLFFGTSGTGLLVMLHEGRVCLSINDLLYLCRKQ